MITAKDKYTCFRRGAKDGFNGKPEDISNTGHPDPEVRKAYKAGFQRGWKLARNISKRASEYSGHTPSPLDVMRDEYPSITM